MLLHYAMFVVPSLFWTLTETLICLFIILLVASVSFVVLFIYAIYAMQKREEDGTSTLKQENDLLHQKLSECNVVSEVMTSAKYLIYFAGLVCVTAIILSPDTGKNAGISHSSIN